MANGSEYVGLEPKFLQRVEGVVEKDNTKANDAVLTFPQKKKKKKKKRKKKQCVGQWESCRLQVPICRILYASNVYSIYAQISPFFFFFCSFSFFRINI